MTTKSTGTAAIFGVVAFVLSVLPVTRVNADCIKAESTEGCPAGYAESSRRKIGIGGGATGHPSVYELTCCTTPSEPYATGESASERAARFQKEEAQLKANCEKKGANWQWDTASKRCNQAPCPEGQIRTKASGGQCAKPGVIEGTTAGKKGGFIQMKPNCAEGFVWSDSENNCVAAPPTEHQNKKKKKKKKKHDDD